MKGSQLVAIIKRLEAMQDADSSEVQTRRFEKNGDERGLVTYDPKTETFELEELADHQTFQFDNIDLVAMEIFDLLDDGTDAAEEQ
ncbi:YkuJ family protein [Lacticaseibacillus pabuli]|uniref:YkuJ family protein n=1 Tax=Lacticaseibacillus pabuli TaxID=3025672 RepID=A0ABY7WSY3_9LACO|nr:YkuJ family protein [Lacticaseibacillus sp. KACC 23028]WDF82071.1 YkuJ family protein [Lacticaseibacillus sp. KACC 23028]